MYTRLKNVLDHFEGIVNYWETYMFNSAMQTAISQIHPFFENFVQNINTIFMDGRQLIESTRPVLNEMTAYGQEYIEILSAFSPLSQNPRWVEDKVGNIFFNF